MVVGFGSTPLVLFPLLNIFPYLYGGPESSNRMSDSHILTFRQLQGWNQIFSTFSVVAALMLPPPVTLQRQSPPSTVAAVWLLALGSKTVTFRPSLQGGLCMWQQVVGSFSCSRTFGQSDSRKHESNYWCQETEDGLLHLLSRHLGEDGAKPKSSRWSLRRFQMSGITCIYRSETLKELNSNRILSHRWCVSMTYPIKINFSHSLMHQGPDRSMKYDI